MPSPHLERKLKDMLGDDAGQELAALTDRIDPLRGNIAEARHAMQAEIAALRQATQAEFSALRQVMQSDSAALRFEIAGLRSAIEQGFVTQDAKAQAAIEKSAREQMRFFILGWGMLMAAI